MILSGLRDTTFSLELTDVTDSAAHLHPRISAPALAGSDYEVWHRIGPPRPWADTDIKAAADWWRAVSENREPVDERHVWFGGGLWLGRVAPLFGADLGIDVIVLDDPNATRPPISYNRGVVGVGDSAHTDFTYITVDTTLEQVENAATWWESLLH